MARDTSTKKLAELLTSYRGRPAEFIEDLLTWQGAPIRLYPYQREFVESVDLLHDHTTLLKCRQSGGSFTESADATAYACTYPYVGIFIVSKTEDQASLIYDYIKGFINDSPLLRNLIVPSTSKGSRKSKADEIVLKNGSRIVSRSAGLLNAATIRGWSVSLLGRAGCVLFDECAYIPGRAVATSLFSAAGGHGLHMISSPAAPAGKFYDACRSNHYRHFHWPARLVKAAGRFTDRDFELWRETLTPAEYLREVEAQFAVLGDAVFDPDDIERAIDPELPLFGQTMRGDPDGRYVYAIDVSRIGCDRWVLVVGELDGKGVLRVVGYHSWAGTDSKDLLDDCDFTDNPDQILEDVYAFHKDKGFHAVKVYVDATSNEYWAHRLGNRYLMNVEKVVWSTSRKEKLISHLNACLKADRLKIPNSDAMRRELLAYTYDLKKMQDNTDKVLYLGGPESDDHLSALAMLAQSVTIQTEKVKPVLRWK